VRQILVALVVSRPFGEPNCADGHHPAVAATQVTLIGPGAVLVSACSLGSTAEACAGGSRQRMEPGRHSPPIRCSRPLSDVALLGLADGDRFDNGRASDAVDCVGLRENAPPLPA
jgi:hypothetical protein